MSDILKGVRWITLVGFFLIAFMGGAFAADCQSNVVAWYALDDTDGTPALDSCGSFNAPFNGNPTEGRVGVFGTSYDFMASGDYLANTTSIIDWGESWSIALWYKPKVISQATEQRLTEKAATTFVYLMIEDTGTAKCSAANEICAVASDGASKTLDSNIVVSTANWYHIILAYEKNNNITMYVNNSQVDTAAIGVIQGGSDYIEISSSGANIEADGYIDEFVVFDEYIDSSVRTRLFTNNTAGSPLSECAAPTFSLTSPTDSSLVNTNQTYSASLTYYDCNNLENMTLYVNGTYKAVNATALVNGTNSINWNFDAGRGSVYNWGMNITNTTGYTWNASNNDFSVTYGYDENFAATEKYTALGINNFTVNVTGGYSNTTTDGNLELILPGLGPWTYNMSFGTYFNETGLSATFTANNQTATTTGIVDTNITFYNNVSKLMQLFPSCLWNSTTISVTSTMEIAAQQSNNSTVSCTLMGFQNYTNYTDWGTFVHTQNWYLQPNQLWLIFTENVTGVVETVNYVQNFTNTTYIDSQYNIEIGYVTVEFNANNSNYDQVFTYYNDNITHVKQYLLVETPDLVKQVKVTANGKAIEDARVCAYNKGTNPDTNNYEWMMTFCAYTNAEGSAELNLNDQNTYKFVVQKSGYIQSPEVLEYIPPVDTEILGLEITEIDSTSGIGYLYSTCGSVVKDSITCDYTISTYTPFSTLTMIVERVTGNTTYFSSDSATKTISIPLTPTLNTTKVYVYADSYYLGSISTRITELNRTINIGWNMPHNSTTSVTLIDRIEESYEMTLLFYILMIICGLIVGMVAERYWNGYGPYGASLFYTVIALSGFPVLWIGALPLAHYAVFKITIPLFRKN